MKKGIELKQRNYDSGGLFFAADIVEKNAPDVAYRLRQQGLAERQDTGSYRLVIERFYGDLSEKKRALLLVKAVLRGYSLNEEDWQFAAQHPYFWKNARGKEFPFALLARQGARASVFELSDVCLSASVRVPDGSD